MLVQHLKLLPVITPIVDRSYSFFMGRKEEKEVTFDNGNLTLSIILKTPSVFNIYYIKFIILFII